jgi:tetratricopeptide (TPR) repeat protein
MNPIAAFPIMMASCACLTLVAGLRRTEDSWAGFEVTWVVGGQLPLPFSRFCGFHRDMTHADTDADTLARAAASLLQRGQLETAESCAREALRSEPGHLGALNVLAVALNALGRYRKASEAFTELTRRAPAVAEHWMNLGTALQAQHRHDEALSAYAQAGARGEASADFFYNVGLVHIDRGSYQAALTVLKDAVRLAPDDAEICYQYAVCCDETMNQDEAVATLVRWPTFRGLNTELLAKIGLLLMNLGEMSSATRAVALAAQDPHPDAESVLRMIQVHERTNRLPEARAALAQLKADPRSASLGTDLKLVEARLADREGRAQEAHDLYLDILAKTRDFHLRHFQLYPLAKSLDALGRYDEAFAALEEAHRSQVAYMSLAAPEVMPRQGPPLQVVDFGCVSEDVAQWDATGAPSADDSPIFIVGFPRSGTTLLEQTLDAHPSLKAMDETRYMHEMVDRMADSGVSYPERLAAMTRAQLDELRAHYWQQVSRRVELAPGQRLVDKNPMNLLALPAIHRLFPNARILLAVRHPCDVILSCYMQHFRAFQFTRLCRDLPTLALGYRRAFDFWFRESAILRPAFREVRYESFVADFESQVRSVAEFLGLESTDAMLQPGEHARRKGFISTPSYSQVVQPVNTRSIGRWKAYERHFAPVLPEVAPYLERWGYSA